jgi:flagellar FliJ protein
VKRFEFRLEQVLKVKRQQERLAELRQQQARFRLEATQAEVAAVQRQIQELAAALDKGIQGAAEQQLWIAHYQRSRVLGQSLTAAEDRVQRAQRELDEADVRRKQIATEVEALLHLRQEQWHAYRQEVARAQQEHLDELGMRRWLTGQQN